MGDASSDDDGVGGQVTAVGEPHPGRVVVLAGDLGDLHTAAQVHSVPAVQVGEELRDPDAQHPEQRQLPCFQDGDFDPRGPGGGRGFQTDPAAADDHDAGDGAEHFLDPVAVTEPPQVLSTAQDGAGIPSRRGDDPVVNSNLLYPR